MKKFILTLIICVFFIVPAFSTGSVYAFYNEEIVFIYNHKEFKYSLSRNIKSSKQFDINYNLNKYNRFKSKEDRQKLLRTLLNIGITNDIALEYLFPNLQAKINLIAKNINSPAKNAQLETNTNSDNVFTIHKERIGIALDRNLLYANLINSYLNNKQLTFQIPTLTTQPDITHNDLSKFTNLRSSFSTNISNSTLDRKHNIKNALHSLNKIEIAPNEVFSFNKTVGRRSMENGYRTAKIIVNNEFVEGVGGGVCQVSSTLYNSALLAGLEIIEANKHSKQVNYVNYGFDAMVNFGSSDLKFKNNTSQKITIITNYSPNSIKIRLFGEHLNGISYRTYNEIFNIEEPIEQVLSDEKHEHLEKVKYTDEFFYLKKGSRGMEIKSYRETLKNGTVLSKELLRHDKFKVQNSVKIYGYQSRENEKSTDATCA